MRLKTNRIPSPLRLARVSAGLRQRDLADAIGRPICYVSRLENGGYALLTPRIAEELAAALDVPAVLIFMGRPK